MVAELPAREVTWKDDDRAATIDLTLDAGGDLSPRVYNVAQNKLSPLSASQQPPFNRRHSYHPVGSKPLRSSPLAGPALSSEGSTLKPPTSLDDRLSRVSSHPDLALLTPPPPVRHARPKSSQGFETSEAGPSRAPTSPVIDAAALPDSPSRHSFFLGLEKRRSKCLSVSSPLEVPPVACPPVPEWALQQRSTHIKSQRRPRSSHADLERNRFTQPRPMSTHGYPIPNGSTSSLTVPVPSLPHASSPRESSGGSWLTTNSYDTTPRFSRLGLASSNVVLPVSAREHKRLSKTSSNASIRSTATVTGSRSHNGASSPTPSLSRSSSSSHLSGSTSSPSTPALSLTRSSSASSDESLRAPSIIPGSNTTSNLSLDITTIVEDDEEQVSQLAEPHHIRTFSISSIRKGTLSRMTSFRHSLKGSRSFNDVNMVLERGSDEGAKGPPSEHVRMNAMDIRITVREHAADGDKVSAALNESKHQEEKGNGISRKQGSIRRLWKTISGTRWGRASR
ncbi:hypothetical protein BDQ17DRAFT_1430770 [Cyathus striatus]|nr:hypothetical protein BDQ17DRAFT_1430770 [Cyathus striatus]